MLDAAGLFLGGFELGADGRGLSLRAGGANVVGVDFPERRMLFDLPIKKRLRDGRIVDLAVAVTAVADQIDDHVGAERVAVLGSHTGNAHDGINVFAVDVKNRDRLAARDASGETGRVLFGVAGGEAEKIIDNNMNGAPDGVSREIGVVHGLSEDALSSKRCVAVDEQRKIFLATTFASAVLLGAGAADGHGIDGFQMTGVRHQVNVNFAAAASLIFAGGAHVVFHVTRAENAARVNVFESGENFLRRTLRHVGDDVQAAAVTHAHDELDRPALDRGVEDFVDQRNQRSRAFEREALAAQIALLHDLLEDVGANEQVQDALLVFLRRIGLHALENPAAALGRVDVIDFDTDGARIDGSGCTGVFAFPLQFGRLSGAEKAERIKVAFEVSELAVSLEYSLTLEVGAV